MKKLLLVLLIPVSLFAQRQIPKGGSVGQFMQIGSDGSSVVWGNAYNLLNLRKLSIRTADTTRDLTVKGAVRIGDSTTNIESSLALVEDFKYFNATITQTSGYYPSWYAASKGRGRIQGSSDGGHGALLFISGLVPDATAPGIGSKNFIASDGRFGMGTIVPSANLEIKGSGTTSATFGLKVQDNTGSSNSFVVCDNGSISIGSSLADASAVLDITNTTKGVALVRVTTTQKNAISSPTEGLEVYDLTLHKKSYYNGTIWVNY